MSAKKGDRENEYGVKLGDRVTVNGKLGIVRFVGKLALNEDLPRAPTYVGVQLYDNVNSPHNGVFRGKRYFHCPPGHAAMEKIGNVLPDPPKKSTPKETARRNMKSSAKEPEFDHGPHCDSCRQTSLIVNISDQEDMAVKDAQKEDQRQKNRSVKRISKQEDADNKQGNSEREIQQWKKKFGSNDRREMMAQTLNKLSVAYKEGRQLMREEKEAAAAAAAATKAELDTETESEAWSER